MPETQDPSHWQRKIGAVLIFIALAVLSLMALVATISDSPAARTVPALGKIGPGRLGQLRFDLMQNAQLVQVGSLQRARQVLATFPLASEPFISAATQLSLRSNPSDFQNRLPLLREAVRRDPRSGPGRALLLRHNVEAGDLREAVEQLAILYRLNATFIEQLLAGFGKAIKSKRNIDDMVSGMTAHQELFLPFMRGFASAEREPELILHLADKLPPTALADPEVRRLTIGQLIRAGDFGRARALWLATAAKSDGTLVHSPDFSDKRSLPPFNWQLEENSTGVAERLTEGGLDIVYYDRAPGPLVSQLVVLRPGNYRVFLQYEAKDGQRGSIGVRLACVNTGVLLGEERLFGREAPGKPVTLDIAVPQTGCGGQMLSLAGLARDDSGKFEIIARRLWVEPREQT